jgi:predicted CoA-binding protein
MSKKKTLIIGASTNPERYSYKAAHSLKNAGHPILQIGLREGEVAGEMIHPLNTMFEDVDTVTLYVGPRHQPGYVDYLKELKPRRLIFNPGTENLDLKNELESVGIQTEEACTLVLLATNQY